MENRDFYITFVCEYFRYVFVIFLMSVSGLLSETSQFSDDYSKLFYTHTKHGNMDPSHIIDPTNCFVHHDVVDR